ncbi:hypothetical protein VCV18_004872 [Metarhizium anisopliae]
MEPSKSRAEQLEERLLTTAERLKVLGVLSDGEIQRVTEARDVLTTVQTIDRRKKYKLFLYEVLRDSSPGAFLLCAIALGQARITNLKAGERTELQRVIRINKNSAINHPTISALAARYQVPSSVNVGGPPQEQQRETTASEAGPSQAVKQPAKRRRTSKTANTPANETQSEPTPDISLNNPNFALVQGELVEHASLEGIAKVFDKHIRGAIRRVEVQSDGIVSTNAAVMMEFPDFALVDCVMMLEVCKEDVERLVKDLFGIDVMSVMGVRHLVLGNGVKLTSNTSNPEVTLKGVRDEAILRILGREIHEAITASRMRRRELEEARNCATECVSMIFTSKSGEGAYINLCLELEGGIRIRDKLFSHK